MTQSKIGIFHGTHRSYFMKNEIISLPVLSTFVFLLKLM
ncbi:similar to putative protein, with at least 6 transmembrane domains, of ancient origin (58.5 kD) (3N884) (predicted), isoform CRA_b [Rattus norvegicus]|uniref:Uncharacterized protein RGD1312038_predicted n=1 Tax=Rattus norvegicus TaxID=10116 RepID=A6HBB7_RAT|nr:similar to putative protein, with at least 6 transmembrane domains, of ancient origin (58.5 kD) (3N884) (predicted), isoform CRA_b [Rattus norvegicus]